MFTSFFRVAFRIFFRDRVQTLINIFGLAIGLAFSIIIFLYIHKELSYDRFHSNSGRLYRIAVNGKIGDNVYHHAITPAPLAKTMVREIPEIESSVRIARFGAWLVRFKEARYNEDSIIFSDSNFFNVFSFALLKGDPSNVLKKPNSIVISRYIAQRYFNTEDPVGKLLRIENDSTYYEVTGIMENIPENSHIQFNMVGTLSTFDKLLTDNRWISHYLYTYCLAKPGTSVEDIQAGLGHIVSDYVVPEYKKFLKPNAQQFPSDKEFFKFIVQPLPEIHLRSDFLAEFEPAGKILYIYLFTALAIVLLILSCMNFISLVTAQSVMRAKEVGVRKIAGSDRAVLIRQFLLESSLLAFFAMALALLFTELSLPAFNKYIGLHLSLGQLLNSEGILLMISLIMVIGLVSGLYPAWQLSSFNPTSVLQHRLNNTSSKGRFRIGLALFQLFIAVGALTMTLIIFCQFRYLVNKDRGYDTSDLVVIRRPDGLKDKLEAYKDQISTFPGVLSVTNTNSAMGGSFMRLPYFLKGDSSRKNYSSLNLLVSFGFDSTYRVEIIKGRFFSRAVPEDSLACVINETAARLMKITDPLGKTLVQLTPYAKNKYEFKIIGVVKDFHFETLENPIRPLVMILMPGNVEGYLTVKLTPDGQEASIQYMKTVWEGFTSAYPFVYNQLDQDKREEYMPVQKTGRIFAFISIITLLMACLGMFALFTFIYSHKQREIGIQKAMGASNTKILLRKAGEVLTLVLIASVIAWAGVYFLAVAWFKDYAYHVNMNILYFISSTLLVAVFSIATVYYHAILTAQINPGKALKYE